MVSVRCGFFEETLNKSPARIASALWARIWVFCFVGNARHSDGYGCAFLLALHPKSRRAASPGLVQRFPSSFYMESTTQRSIDRQKSASRLDAFFELIDH